MLGVRMARTATASAGKAKGPAKRKATPKPPAKKTPTAPAKKRARRSPNGQGKAPDTQAAFLATVQATTPGITADQLAAQFRYDFADVVRMRHFVHEYIKDFNEVNAALRMGYPQDAARHNGALFFGQAYVRLRVGELLASMEAENIVSGAQIIAALWREANAPDVAFSSNSSTRIAALNALAKIKGLMGAAVKKAAATVVQVPGVMLVPFTTDADQWENHARQTQRDLKQAVIDV